jgi:putative transposase
LIAHATTSCYHITHRCLDREFFFEHALTRDTYLKELREMITRFQFDILNDMITSNHVHILVYAGSGMEIEKGMQYLQGRMAQRYNMRTGCEDAFRALCRYKTLAIAYGLG